MVSSQYRIYEKGRVMVLNATFNNISAISWQSVSLVEETEYPEKTIDLITVNTQVQYYIIGSS
jgi:hypothetical protein